MEVLARSEKKNCSDFIKNGIFRNATWHLYKSAFPIDRWIKLGRENCILLSALIVEQLRFWKVCIQYGYCVSYFSVFFPALCMWLNVPTFEELIEKNVLDEFAAITKEAFLVLGALTKRLPNFYSSMHVSNGISEVNDEEVETWCWAQVGPVVDLAIKWTQWPLKKNTVWNSSVFNQRYKTFAAASYGDMIYGRQVVIYLHRCVETSVRLSAWNALSNARVLELLPPLENCIAKAEGYLEPVEDNEQILEAYLKSWVFGALDRAVTRGSVAFRLVLHHLSSFIFFCSNGDKLLLRNKLAKSLLRNYSSKQQHEGMMIDFIEYQKPGQREEASSMHMHEVERRFMLLTEACEGNSSLLRNLEKLSKSG
ncbi:hypothetical protein U1Q18_034655 [Sarracenia purpurea var. burkii]